MTPHAALALRAMGEEELRAVYRVCMRRDFPKSELKPLRAILRMRREGVYDALGAYDQGERVAYALIYRGQDSRAALLDYFAVEPAWRGHGAGGDCIALLRAHYAGTRDALLIECELPEAAPDEAQASARLRFYERTGARLTDLAATLFGVEFRILCLPCRDGAQVDCERELDALYRQMLTPRGYARWAKIRRLTGNT